MTSRHLFPLRWNDNDQYGHMNNTVYYEAMDSAVNTFMMRRADLDPAGDVIGLARASSCEFLAPASFPEVLEVDIAVARLGTTSITWDLAIVREGAPGRDDPLALGRFTHVFVDRERRRPVPIPGPIRAAVEAELRIGEA
ncbi:thioesterase family protein [Glycomyces sp. NRRL B-16210]|uniref:acyl-CoA thioesterase n=1 Tax=Glycomyces sp. NRRL B-16210 TaxID=1463821 RepID=UPI0004BEC507|nr:thioesterase family protein [Glycomyces sp. NRRL B-16210]